MAVTGIGDNTYAAGVYKTAVTKTEEEKNAAKASATQAAAETTTTSTPKTDTFEKSTQYKMDMDTVNSMKADLKNNVSSFHQMVQGLMQKQGGVGNHAMNVLLNIDKATQESAKAAISEEGEWGVNAVANRILDFAKALSGGDPDKIEALRGAFEKGFSAAEKIWGGNLPQISYDTREAVRKGFDDWAAESNKVGETTTVEK